MKAGWYWGRSLGRTAPDPVPIREAPGDPRPSAPSAKGRANGHGRGPGHDRFAQPAVPGRGSPRVGTAYGRNGFKTQTLQQTASRPGGFQQRLPASGLERGERPTKDGPQRARPASRAGGSPRAGEPGAGRPGGGRGCQSKIPPGDGEAPTTARAASGRRKFWRELPVVVIVARARDVIKALRDQAFTLPSASMGHTSIRRPGCSSTRVGYHLRPPDPRQRRHCVSDGSGSWTSKPAASSNIFRRRIAALEGLVASATTPPLHQARHRPAWRHVACCKPPEGASRSPSTASALDAGGTGPPTVPGQPCPSTQKSAPRSRAGPCGTGCPPRGLRTLRGPNGAPGRRRSRRSGVLGPRLCHLAAEPVWCFACPSRRPSRRLAARKTSNGPGRQTPRRADLARPGPPRARQGTPFARQPYRLPLALVRRSASRLLAYQRRLRLRRKLFSKPPILGRP